MRIDEHASPQAREGQMLLKIEEFRRRRPRLIDDHITMAHGAGGKSSAALTDSVFLEAFRNPLLEVLGDGALRWRLGREGQRWAAQHRWPCVAEAICREYVTLVESAGELALGRCV